MDNIAEAYKFQWEAQKHKEDVKMPDNTVESDFVNLQIGKSALC